MTHRQKLDGLVMRAFEIVAEATERDFTADEMAEMIHCLTMASVQFKRLPGAIEALEVVKLATESEQQRRLLAPKGTP